MSYKGSAARPTDDNPLDHSVRSLMDRVAALEREPHHVIAVFEKIRDDGALNHRTYRLEVLDRLDRVVEGKVQILVIMGRNYQGSFDATGCADRAIDCPSKGGALNAMPTIAVCITNDAGIGYVTLVEDNVAGGGADDAIWMNYAIVGRHGATFVAPSGV